MSQKRTVQMNLFDNRNGDEPTWLLPPWGHPLGIGVNPLFLELDGWIRPIGTAFNLGGGLSVTITAFHCVEEAIKLDPLLHQRFQNQIYKDGVLKHAGLYILRHYPIEGGVHFSLVPLENVAGNPPGDVVFCSPQFQAGNWTMGGKLSFALPEIGDPIHSVGYCEFVFPEGGIPLADAANFDWTNGYAHSFRVIEGRIRNVFAREYAGGYLRGPCFSFEGRIAGGMSGGPIFDLRRGVIFGMNSATAFDDDLSLGSLFYPYVLNSLTCGANILGDPRFRMNVTNPILAMLQFGSISSDGSFEDLAIQASPEGHAVTIAVTDDYRDLVFDDLLGLQSGTPPQRFEGEVLFLRTVKAEEEE